jgi:hypothetical protein
MARPPSTAIMRRPVDVEVSAQVGQRLELSFLVDDGLEVRPSGAAVYRFTHSALPY